MNLKSVRFLPRNAPRLLLAALCSLPLELSCSDDEAAAPLPLDFSVQVASLEPGPELPLRCDGTMAVTVNIDPGDGPAFILRPRHSCGSSNRCGYVHVEALDSSGNLLASVDTATSVGLLEVAPSDLPAFSEVRVSLLRGVDDEPVINADGEAVTASASVTSAPPGDCPAEGAGGGGQGGAGSDGTAGAGGAPAPAGGGAGGDGAGGSPDQISGGQGGVMNAGGAGGDAGGVGGG